MSLGSNINTNRNFTLKAQNSAKTIAETAQMAMDLYKSFAGKAAATGGGG